MKASMHNGLDEASLGVGLRTLLQNSQNIVVKVGTRILVDARGKPDEKRFVSLVRQIAKVKAQGRSVVLVSSGAIGAGIEALGWKSRPTNLPDIQMAASVGQTRLMSRYDRLFAEEGIKVGQVLLTHDDLKNRTRHLNVRSTMTNLLRHGVVPIINENDVVSVDEIRFGDNDTLAALTSILIDADLLVIMTSVNGLQERLGGEEGRRISYIARVTKEVLALARGKGSELSTGGMASKLQAAAVAARAGVAVVMADGRKSDTLLKVVGGADVGTLIAAADTMSRVGKGGRKKWLAFFHRAKGTVRIDKGAVRALEEGGNSLLAVGVTQIDGAFNIGDLVNVRSETGRLVAKGLVEFSHEELYKIRGKKVSQIEGILGHKDYDEVIHRDNLVLLNHIDEDVE